MTQSFAASKDRAEILIKSFFQKFKKNRRENSDESANQPELDRLTVRRNSIDRSQRGWNWVPDWEKIFNVEFKDWQSYLKNASGKKILIASLVSNANLSPLESILCVALTLRGAKVEVLICDGALPACMNATGPDQESREKFAQDGPSNCDWCCSSQTGCYEQLGIKVHYLSELLKRDEIEEVEKLAAQLSLQEIRAYSEANLPIGEHAYAGALRFFARGDLATEPLADKVVKRYFAASLLTARAMKSCYEKFPFEHTLVNHGIYVPAGIVAACSRELKAGVSTFTLGYRKRTAIFSHSDTYHHTLMDEPIEAWDSIEWNDELEKITTDYLSSRWYGTNDWIYFHDENPQFKTEEIEKELGMSFSKPTIGLLTNVVWDAQLHYPANAFSNMTEWIEKTVKYFEGRPELQLLIRIHPAEIRGYVKSRQKVVDELAIRFDKLPENVFVIPPESAMSTYVAMAACDAAIIYGTKAGLELTSMGIPTIVAGEAWIRNKGLTHDAASEDDYFKILDRLPFDEKRLSATEQTRAKKYAFHYFYRRMIPLNVINPHADKEFPMDILPVGLSGFLPGADKGIDTICDGVLLSKPFIYHAETNIAQ